MRDYDTDDTTFLLMKGTTDSIRHFGTIAGIEGCTLHVKIMQSAACAACHAAKLCQSSEVKEKVVDACVAAPDLYHIGQQVVVVGSVHQGLKATVYAYILPLLLMVVVLACCLKAGMDESLSAGLAIGSLVPYFFLIYLLRDKFRRRFFFEVERPGTMDSSEQV